MTTLLLFGATGMVGSEVLHLALQDHRVSQVISVGRRGTGVTDRRLHEVIHRDLTQLAPLEPLFARADACIHCLGVYTGAVPDDEFWTITFGYIDALVGTLERVRPGIRFVLMGAQGADPTERSRLMFAKAKGRAERRLTESRLEHRHILRPGYIKPGRTPTRSRAPDWLARAIYRVWPGLGVDAPDLARVLLEIAVTGQGAPLYSNGEIRRAAEQLARG